MSLAWESPSIQGVATPCCGTVRNDRFFDTLKKEVSWSDTSFL